MAPKPTITIDQSKMPHGRGNVCEQLGAFIINLSFKTSFPSITKGIKMAKTEFTNLACSLGICEQEGSSKMRVERPDDVIENFSHIGIV